MKAVVVGAGVGGLASAAALSKAGWDVVVVEKSPDARPIGAALVLWSNAFRALDLIDPGLGGELGTGVAVHGQAALRRPDGSDLIRLKPRQLDDGSGIPPQLVGRPALHAALRSRLPADALRLGRTATNVTQQPDGATVTVEPSTPDPDVTGPGSGGPKAVEPETYHADLVVAADGIGSRLRSLVDSASVVASAGYATWRGMAPAGAIELSEGGETWGVGQRFGYSTRSDGGLYWYATLANHDSRLWRATSEPMELDRLQHLFREWHHPIGSILQATPIGSVFRTETAYLWPLPSSFVHDRLALLGDAAHAMTPDLGQGACQALEDAAELGLALDGGVHGRVVDVPGSLRTYDRLRRPRTTRVAKRARTIGRAAQLDAPAATTVRNALIRLLPARLAVAGIGDVTAWKPSTERRGRGRPVSAPS